MIGISAVIGIKYKGLSLFPGSDFHSPGFGTLTGARCLLILACRNHGGGCHHMKRANSVIGEIIAIPRL